MNLFGDHHFRNIEGAYYVPSFLDSKDQERYFSRLRRAISFDQNKIVFGGRSFDVPRLESWHGDGEYTYSGITHNAKPWTDELLEIKKRIEDYVSKELDIPNRFNSVLVNLYRDGSDSVGYHADDEKDLGPEWPDNILISSVSLGVARKFVLKRNRDNHREEIVLSPGSLFIMSGKLQTEWKHSIPKTKKPVGERINLTYRIISSG